jgi:hypothetical protein
MLVGAHGRAPNALVYPESMRFLAAHALGLIKSTAFRCGRGMGKGAAGRGRGAGARALLRMTPGLLLCAPLGLGSGSLRIPARVAGMCGAVLPRVAARAVPGLEILSWPLCPGCWELGATQRPCAISHIGSMA